MSEQMKDPFIWEGEEWTFVGADHVYDLFDPEGFGLKPKAPHTACWKGFVVTFSIKSGELYLESLRVHTEDDVYPDINGVKAKADGRSFHAYKKLHMKLKYSGTIIVGQEFKEEFHHRAFTGPHSYSKTVELKFEEGILVDSKDTSGTYIGF